MNKVEISIADIPLLAPAIGFNLQETVTTQEKPIIKTKAVEKPKAVVKKQISTPKAATTYKTIWADITKDFKLDHRVNSKQVQNEIRKLLRDKKKFQSVLNDSSPYIHYIYNETKSRGLPAELALLPVIESEFSPGDHSSKGATGLWQLMSPTAKGLGVKVVPGYDGRRSVTVSTRAALVFLTDLGKSYKKNWYLALAAYNAGPGRVNGAIRKAGTRNYWVLPLPRETKLYVPKFLAVAAIVKNPKKYGVTLPHINNKPYFAEVKLKSSITLASAAKSLNVSLSVLKKLNPDYKTSVIASKKGTYSLLIPVEKVSTAKSKLSAVRV